MKKKIWTDDIESIMESGDRQRAGKTAQPHGLYLNRIFLLNKRFKGTYG